MAHEVDILVNDRVLNGIRIYTPAQVTEITHVAPSTLRKYVAEFRGWLSEGVQKRRNRLFTEQDVVVIQYIKEFFSSGLSAEEIDLRLGTLDIPATPQENLALIPTIGASLVGVQDTARSALETITQLQDTVKRQQIQIDSILLELKQVNAALFRVREDHDRLIKRLEQAENTSSLWDRLAGKGAKPTGR